MQLEKHKKTILAVLHAISINWELKDEKAP